MVSLFDLPSEIIYFIFKYLQKEHIAYSFLELNDYLASNAEYFIGEEFDLTKVQNKTIFQYCLSTVLPIIGSNLRHLSIGHPYCLSNYIKNIQTYCPNLEKLNVYCCFEEDVRHYVFRLMHHQLMSLTFLLNGKIVGEQISLRLLNRALSEEFQKVATPASLVLYLSSMKDLVLLKRYSESSYIPNGLYMIECMSTGQWLTDGQDDLCIMTKKFHRECIFSIKQIDDDQCCLEYELRNEQTHIRLTVLSCYEDEEYWIPSSILSTHRKESFQSCSTFTFEKVNDQNQFYIRPCYSRAKRLQVLGNRIIVSLHDNDSTLDHGFRFHRIS